MGLFDKVVGGLAGKLGTGNAQNMLLDTVMGLINNPQTGGLPGLVQNLKDKGLGDVVNSWVSTGNNLPISGEQIRQFLGGDQIQQLAAKVGASKDDASNMLAQLLPQVIDRLTPDGKLPEGGVLEQGLDALKKKLLG